MSDATIDHAIATGRLYPVFRAVFGLYPRVEGRARMLAAVLACGEGSVVSHGTAAFLLSLWDRQPRHIDVIAPIQAGRKIAGIRRRHTPPPSRHDAIMHGRVPCTSPSRTIVDLAGIVGEATLRRTIEQASVNRMLDVADIRRVLAGPRRRGSPLLRMILEDWSRYSSAPRVRSVLEARLLSLLTQHDIPAPQCNVKLTIENRIFEIDFLWPRERFIVETDGSKYHDNPEAQARDRRRDRLLTAAGYGVWRLKWDDLNRRPQATMAELTRRLHHAKRG